MVVLVIVIVITTTTIIIKIDRTEPNQTFVLSCRYDFLFIYIYILYILLLKLLQYLKLQYDINIILKRDELFFNIYFYIFSSFFLLYYKVKLSDKRKNHSIYVREQEKRNNGSF